MPSQVIRSGAACDLAGSSGEKELGRGAGWVGAETKEVLKGRDLEMGIRGELLPWVPRELPLLLPCCPLVAGPVVQAVGQVATHLQQLHVLAGRGQRLQSGQELFLCTLWNLDQVCSSLYSLCWRVWLSFTMQGEHETTQDTSHWSSVSRWQLLTKTRI